MAEFKVRLRDLSRPLAIATGAANKIIVNPFSGRLLEMEDVNFHLDSAVLLPDLSSDAGTLPEQDRVTGIDVLASALLEARDNPSDLVVIAGHTDRSGTADYNLALSQMRADNVMLALVGKREEWADSCNARYQVEDYQEILTWVSETFGFDCDPGGIDGKSGPLTVAALTNFQTQYNLRFTPEIPVDGLIGPATWRAFFDLYMEELKSVLNTDDAGLATLRQPFASGSVFLDPSKPTVGCGFHHPVDEERLASGDDDASGGGTPTAAKDAKQTDAKQFRSAKDRRVEILFFAPADKPKLDCHPAKGKCNPALCEIYNLHHFEFDYIPVKLVTSLDFFGRPATQDTRSDKVHNVIVAPGDSVVLHWTVANADRVQITGTTLDGVATPVSLPGGGSITKSATPQDGQATVAVTEDTTFSLAAFDGQRRDRDPQRVDVHVFATGAINPPQLATGEDFIDLDSPADQTELLARALAQPSVDARIAGPVTAPATPPQPPPRTQSVAPKATAPALLDFVATSQFLADLSAPAIRAKTVKTIRDFFAFGVANLPKGRKAAYGDLLSFGETAGIRNALLVKSVGNSSCALVIRSLWRLLGARDFVTTPPLKEPGDPSKHQNKLQDGLLLGPPFIADGLLISRLLRYASLTKALNFVRTTQEIAAFNPQPGDVIFLTKTVVKPNKDDKTKDKTPTFTVSQQHIFTVTKRSGNDIFSIDGGQVSPKKLSDGTPLHLPVEGPPEDHAPDGTCNGIWSAHRTLEPVAIDRVLVDRSAVRPQTDDTGKRLGFKGESRPIDAWIDVTKLSFTATIIELVKNGGRVKPGLPEDGVVPSIDPTNLDTQIP